MVLIGRISCCKTCSYIFLCHIYCITVFSRGFGLVWHFKDKSGIFCVHNSSLRCLHFGQFKKKKVVFWLSFMSLSHVSFFLVGWYGSSFNSQFMIPESCCMINDTNLHLTFAAWAVCWIIPEPRSTPVAWMDSGLSPLNTISTNWRQYTPISSSAPPPSSFSTERGMWSWGEPK